MSIYEIKIQILDKEGRRLSVERSLDAPMVFEFGMIDDALDFLRNYLEGENFKGFRVNDDGKIEAHKVESFMATEYGQDVTDLLNTAFVVEEL